MIGFVERPKPAKHIGRLTHHQPQVRQVQRDILEAQYGLCLSLMARKDALVELEKRQRDPALDATLELEQLEVQVDRIRQLGMFLAERAQFLGLPRLGSRAAS